MTKEQLQFIEEYYDKVAKAVDTYNENLPFEDMESDLFDTIFETKTVFAKELPEIEDAVMFRSGTGIRDAQTVLGIMKKHMIANGYKEKAQKNNQYQKFWNSFKTYFETKTPYNDCLRPEYIGYDNWDGGTNFLDINYNYEYNLHYGVDFEDDFSDIESIKLFVELAFAEWIKIDKRYDFTKDVNAIFRKMQLPYKLQNGKVVNQGYKTTNLNDKIINYSMLERKINYAEEMITSKETLDKKCALDYIIDALQYIISIQNGKYVKDKYSSSAKTISDDINGKVYAVVNQEIDELMKISNEYFDIRHNEYLNKLKEKREPITDNIFIEYLYNRAYSLLYILRLKANIPKKVEPKEND